MEGIKKLKVLIVSSEVAPFMKTGGLGDVCGSLPKALKRQGVDIRAVLPKYKDINAELIKDISFLTSFDVSLSWRRQKADVYYKKYDFPMYFIDNDYYFNRDGIYGHYDDGERFAFFSKAVLDMLPAVDFIPDVIHLNDWQTGPVSLFLKETYKDFLIFKNTKTLFTIHNLQFQGNFGADMFDMFEAPEEVYKRTEFDGKLSFMKTGIEFSDLINTVSKTYMYEIQTPAFGCRMENVIRSRSGSLKGVLNGIDFEEYNPETDKAIYQNYNSSSFYLKHENKKRLRQEIGLNDWEVPLLGMVSRLTSQKGFDIFLEAAQRILDMNVELAVLGTGESYIENALKELEGRNPGRVKIILGFNEALAHKIYAASDFFVMPSYFEPCGLSQIIALRYGSVPIVRKVGGLNDTVWQYNSYNRSGNGFVFENYDANALIWSVGEALGAYRSGEWENIVKNAMASNFSWEASAKEYIDIYKGLMKE